MRVLVVRKQVKNLHLAVLPPNGHIRVTAPIGMNDDTVRTFIALRLPWINRQREKFVAQARQTARRYVSGESHYYFGKRYLMDVVQQDAAPKVRLVGKRKIELCVRPESTGARRGEIMSDWYRECLRAVIAEMLEVWQAKLGVRANRWRIMRMRTRWGTCTQGSGNILFNLELAKKPLVCVEYVIVHELLHLIERGHNQRFIDLLDRHLPKWRTLKEELNHHILAHEEWLNIMSPN
jgi:predicted metal-dependent hydrolase